MEGRKINDREAEWEVGENVEKGTRIWERKSGVLIKRDGFYFQYVLGVHQTKAGNMLIY